MLRELDAAIDSRDVDQLEEAIRKGDAWAKRAPVNHFMSQVGTAGPACCTASASHFLCIVMSSRQFSDVGA